MDLQKLIIFANLYFRVRSQKAYCDRHTDIVVDTKSSHLCFLCGSVFLSKARMLTMTDIWT